MTPTDAVDALVGVAESNEQRGRLLRAVSVGLFCAALIVGVCSFWFGRVIDRIEGATHYSVDRSEQSDCIREINNTYAIADKNNSLAITNVVFVALTFGEGPELREANELLAETAQALTAAGMDLEHVAERCPPVEAPGFAD